MSKFLIKMKMYIIIIYIYTAKKEIDILGRKEHLKVNFRKIR